ncbi:The GLUG motif-containing protein, partial [Pseudomonas cuatrocienegasensis]
GYYALAQDLDASGTTYNQALVGTSFANAFTGTFTGLGHTVSNLTINSATQDYIGLFGRTGSTSQIRDIGLVGGSVTGNVYVGALVGRSGGSINNAYATGNVTGWGVVGGLAGFNDSGTISNAHATGNVTGIEGVGGLLGVNHGIISNVYATGNVNAETNYAGGLVGKSAKSTTADSTINNAYATGNVTGGSSVGGLVGDSSNSTISNAHATGSVKGNSMVGGLVGQNFSASISNAFATGNVTGAQGSVGGLAGYNGGSTISNAYATGDITAAAEAAFAGGLVGNNNFGTIRNVYATGNVTGGRRGVGGLLGYSDDGSTLSYAYASGSVTSSGSDVGGLIGENYNSTTTAIFYATTDADGNIINNGGQATGVFTGNTNGEAKTWGELTNANTYSGWDNSIWVFTANADVEGYYQGMPYLVGVTREQDIAGGTLFQSGWGTTQSPYSITNWLQLANIGNVLNGGYYFSLSNNLDQDSLGYTTLASATANAGAGWNPLGNIVNPFTGTFDGLSHTISDLNIARSDTNNVGLFGYTGSGSVIRNIGLVGGSVSGRNFVGGLVGYNSRGTISNAYVTGSVSGNINVGGLVGVSDSGTIRNAYTTGSVLGSDYVGGLVGYNVRGSINNAYTTGSVSGRNFVGGLVGYNSEGAIGSAYATGSVLGSDNVGGLIGYNFQATISNAYATGNVSGNSQVGGLVGLNNSGTISSSFYATTDGDGNAINGSGATTSPFNGNRYGTGKTWAELTQASTFTGWDIATTGGSNAVWRIYNGHSGPMLRSFLQSVTLTADASGGSQTYDGSAATGTTTYTSTLGNALDTSKLLGNLSYTSNSKNAGTYNSADGTLTLSGLYSGQQGYDISYTDTSLTISKANLAITGISALNKTYDATTAATLAGSASVKVLGADVVAVTGTGVGTFADKNAGTNKAVTVTGYALSGTDADNYNIVLPSGLTADIDKVDLAVTALDASKTYDGLAFTGGNGVSYSGFVNGENADVLGGSLTYGGSAQGAVNAGLYELNVSGLTSDNYAISYNTGSLNVDKAAATVTANSGQVTYNGQQQNITGFTASGLVNGETADVLSGVSTLGGGINAGTYTHSARGTDGNYALTFVDGALTIDKAALTVTANNVSKTYDGLSFSGGNGVSYNGLVNGEDASVLGGTLVYAGSAQGAVNAGSYELNISGLTSGNYAISYNAGSLNVDKAAATVTANSGTVTYNGQRQGITGFTASGLVNGETADVLSGVSTTGGAGINAGTYTHSANGTDGNYALTFVDGALTIDKAALTVTANNVSKTYDGLAFNGGHGVSYSGFVNGENADVLGGTLTYGGSAQGAINAGLYDLSVSGLTSGNYAIRFLDGSLTINAQRQAALPQAYGDALAAMQPTRDSTLADLPSRVIDLYQVADSGIRLPEGL